MKSTGTLTVKNIAISFVALFCLIITGLFFAEAAVGIWIVLLYGVFSLVRKVKSVDTYAMVMVLLAFVPIATLRGNEILAQNFAEYAFLLLGFALIGTMLEERRKATERS